MPVPVIIAMEFAGKCMKCWAVAVQVFKKGQAKQDLHLVAGCFTVVFPNTPFLLNKKNP